MKKEEILAKYTDRVAYMGLRDFGAGWNSNYVHCFVRVVEGEPIVAHVLPANILVFKGNLHRDLGVRQPGAIFPVRLPEGKGIEYMKRVMPVAYVPDDVRFDWQAKHLAATKTQDAEKASNRVANRDLIAEICDPLARKYERLPTGPQKAQFLARIVFLVTRSDA